MTLRIFTIRHYGYNSCNNIADENSSTKMHGNIMNFRS
jgi:hypothetical protein